MAADLTLNWTANPASEQVASYLIQSSPDGSTWTNLTAVAGTSYTIVNVSPDPKQFRIIANNVSGLSEPSDPVEQPPAPSKPATPTVTVTYS